MESSWRFNVAEQGLANWTTALVNIPIRLLSRSTEFPGFWIGYFINEVGQIVAVGFTAVDGQLTPNFTQIEPPGSRFPFEFAVEPDVH